MSDLLPTTPYRGTRDFYPEDMRFRREMFARWRRVCEAYGYGEVDGPLLEPLATYAAKTSDEIVRTQLYHFTDRGGREMAIRPEFTPTMARLAASKLQDLPLPVRWYAIPNVWRYENPQRGRLREHWQLNVDMFGVDGIGAEVEMLSLAQDLLKAFGAPSGSFELRVNSRRLTDHIFRKMLGLTEEQCAGAAAAVDRRAKVEPEVFQKMLSEAGLSEEQQKILQSIWSQAAHAAALPPLDALKALESAVGQGAAGIEDLRQLAESLVALGSGDSLRLDLSVMRGFAYYTGTVFEIFDTHPENNRSLFGGGRYDNLMGAFSKRSLSGFGFGMGDVTFENFLKVHGLLPKLQPAAQAAVLVMGDAPADRLRSQKLASQLREGGASVFVTLAGGKMGKQIQTAEKAGATRVVIFGPDEENRGVAAVKDLASGEQKDVSLSTLANELA
ncbi:MAG: histidine--tRNA ligase [Planctomycetota bacterium]